MSDEPAVSSPHMRPNRGRSIPWDKLESEMGRRIGDQGVERFVHELRSRGFDQVLFCSWGVEGLYLAMTPQWPLDGDVLKVRQKSDGRLEFVYLGSGQKRTKNKLAGEFSIEQRDPGSEFNWSWTYAPEEALAAFERFVVRARWLPRNHPLLRNADRA